MRTIQIARALAKQREYLAGLMLAQCVASGSGPELEQYNGVWQQAAELIRSGAGENALLERFIETDGDNVGVDEVEQPEPLPNFYDRGWNARVAGKPFTSESSRSWQDGWKDCDGAPEADRTPMGDPPPLPSKRGPSP